MPQPLGYDFDRYRGWADEEVLALTITEPALFEVLVRRYQEAFVRKAVTVLRDETLAADAVQETFIRIYLVAARFKKQVGASFKSWAFKILLNQCFTIYRKQKREVSLEGLEAESWLADDRRAEGHAQLVASDYLWSLVSRLPLIFRRTVELFLQDKDVEEIAAAENISANLVRVRLYRAKQLLKKLSGTLSL